MPEQLGICYSTDIQKSVALRKKSCCVIQRSDVEGRDMYGNTVLHLASFSGHPDVCRELLLLQTTTDASSSCLDVLNDDGCTPLDLAKRKPTRRWTCYQQFSFRP